MGQPGPAGSIVLDILVDCKRSQTELIAPTISSPLGPGVTVTVNATVTLTRMILDHRPGWQHGEPDSEPQPQLS
jgi:hypothetical protein